jgi:hypothetical protein
MYKQNQLREREREANGKPCPAWKSVARFLSQAAVGGALGGYAVLVGNALYQYRNPYNFWLIIGLPFWLVGGAVLGLATGALTLLFENLIEEKLSAQTRVIVTSAIATLIFFGLDTFRDSASWQLLKTASLPGGILGLPIGLVAGSRLRLWRVLLLGVDKPPGDEADAVSGATSILYGFSLIGGFALRLVSASGFLIGVLVLACCSNFQQTDQVMVTIFSVYYFACTAYIACMVRHRWAIAAAGTFLNTLLLLLALLWDPVAAEAGQPGPLMIAFFVLAFLWMLFAGGHVAPRKRAVTRLCLER